MATCGVASGMPTCMLLSFPQLYHHACSRFLLHTGVPVCEAGSKWGCGHDAWLMHESFWKDDATSFSRPWFAWANSMFGGLMLQLSKERPHLLSARAELAVRRR